MSLHKLLIMILIDIVVKNAMSLYNPQLTYTIRFKKFTMHGNITMYYNIDQYKDGQYINGNLTFHTKLLIDKVIVIFHRCDSEGINCEYFQTWTLTDICPKLKDKTQLWSRWYGSFDPPMVCPIDKGNYQVKNGTVDLGVVLLLYPQATDYHWKLTQKIYSKDIFIGSYTGEGYFFGYRKKIKSMLKL